MWGYRKRVERDLARWHDEGWVTDAGANAIRQELSKSSSVLSASNTLAILSAVLIGFGVMSFVAANWQDIPRLIRLGLLIGLLWSAYGLAYIFAKRSYNGFSQAAILLGVSVFGASIMLISQMYHMHGNPSDAVLLWGCGALLAGVVLRSNPALAFAMILFAVWGFAETAKYERVFWPFLVPWAAVSAAFYAQRWAPGVHLSGLTLSGFIISVAALLFKDTAYWIVVAVGLAVMAAAVYGPKIRADLPKLWSGALNYGIALTLFGFFGLQIFDDPSLGLFFALAIVILAFTLGVVSWGSMQGSKGALWLGYLGFSIEVLAIYFRTLGSLLNNSLFFVVSGLVVAGLAYAAHRLHLRNSTVGAPAHE